MKEIKKFYNKNKKIINIVGVIVLLLIIVFLVYKIFFSKSNSDRYEGIKSHELTKKEIKNIKDTVNSNSKVKSIDVYIKSKIIRILVTLDDDVEFDIIKDVANKSVGKIDKDNLKFYDVEFFVDTKNESKTYPKIGYKHKTSDVFVW